jgi:hypothetical protein
MSMRMHSTLHVSGNFHWYHYGCAQQCCLQPVKPADTIQKIFKIPPGNKGHIQPSDKEFFHQRKAFYWASSIRSTATKPSHLKYLNDTEFLNFSDTFIFIFHHLSFTTLSDTWGRQRNMPSGKYKLLKHQHCKKVKLHHLFNVHCANETYSSSMLLTLHALWTYVLNNFSSKHHFFHKIFKDMCLRHMQKNM